MTIHLLGMPHTEMTKDWSFCAYTDRTRVLANMLHDQGHTVRLYSGEHSESRARNVPLMTRHEQREWWSWYDGSQVFNDFDPASPGWSTFNARAIREIAERADSGDVLGITMGTSQRPVADALPGLRAVEVGIGYTGVFAPYRVFESNVWRHYMASREPTDDLRWFDAVIPRAYEVDDFPLGDGSGGYLLYVGRLAARKGVTVAAEVAKATGSKLLVAGQGMAKTKKNLIVTTDGSRIEGDVEYIGVLDPKQRAKAMGDAMAVVMPTNYLEPGGGVAIEAQLCGTPVLTVPWGAMTETVIEGLTGFHCGSLADFVHAYAHAEGLDRPTIRSIAVERFGTERLGEQWTGYLAKLDTLHGAGWYQL